MNVLDNALLPGGSRTNAWLFLLLLAAGTSCFWLAPRLPLTDLPQHAAQIAAVKEILLGRFQWGDIVEVTWFTPYLLVTLSSAIMNMVLPIHLVLALNLSLAYLMYVGVCILLRQRLEGDPQFDFLFLIGFFGFSYQYGFYSYLVSVPFGLLFMLLALDYARQPGRKGAFRLLLLGCILFFMHGLVFVFAGLIGGALLLRAFFPKNIRDLKRLVQLAIPYVCLGFITLLYVISTQTLPETATDWKWDWHRIWNILILLPSGDLLSYAAPSSGLVAIQFVRIGAIILLLSMVLANIGYRRLAHTDNLIFIAVLMLVLAVYPCAYNDIYFLYERHHIYFLPFLALLTHRGTVVRPNVIPVVFMACSLYLGANITGTWRFADESPGYDDVVAKMEPGQRVLSLSFWQRSFTGSGTYAYLHYPVWYQSEQGGWVDFNFAENYQQIVHYPYGTDPTWSIFGGWKPEKFKWRNMGQARQYRYFVVHQNPRQPVDVLQLLTNPDCDIRLLAESGQWQVYERTACRSEKLD